jgi:hypothetical protein
VFFSQQDDRPGAFNYQLATAAEIGNTRGWILGQQKLYLAGSKIAGVLPLLGLPGDNPASCREKNTSTPQ